MATFRVNSKDLAKLVQQHAKERYGRVKKSIRKSAGRGAKYVRANMPIAFGELRDGTEARGYSIVTEAPHAGAVENGSRPHWVPLEALKKWVILRGLQGLGSSKQLARLRGTTTAQHARTIAQQIRNYTLTDGSDAVAVDAPEQIARAIQAAIAKRGTKPHHYMLNAVPTAIEILAEEIPEALPDR